MSSPADAGSAVVEFVFLGTLLLLPLVYLVLCLGQIQAGSYAVAAASREAGRAFVTATSEEDAMPRARAAAQIAFEDQGFDGGAVEVACDADPCLRPEGRVTVRTSVQATLPLVPAFLSDVVPLEIPLTAQHLVTVDRFRGAR
ncbi:MAG: pilus assembly protein [Micrococcales bacterium]|nr:pilus assembly protein [Micrococcales bacterium]